MTRIRPSVNITKVSQSLYRHTGIIPTIEYMDNRIKFTIRTDRVLASGAWKFEGKQRSWVDPELYIDGVRVEHAPDHMTLGLIIRDPDWWKANRPYTEPKKWTIDRTLAPYDGDIPFILAKTRDQLVLRGHSPQVGQSTDGKRLVLFVEMPKATVRIEYDRRGMVEAMHVETKEGELENVALDRIEQYLRSLMMPTSEPGSPPPSVRGEQKQKVDRGVEIRKGEVRRV